MKPKTILRVLSISLALSMLTAYVVYSQKQQQGQVAPSSKFRMIAPNGSGITNPTNSTHFIIREDVDWTVMSFSSKSAAPLLKIPAAPGTNLPAERPVRIAPGSKSAPLFDFSQEKEPVNTNAVPLSRTNAVKNTRR